MGLDISYFSNIEKVGEKPKDDKVYDFDILIWNPECFEYQLGGLDKKFVYNLTKESEYGSFRAGSYGGYNRWRDELGNMMGYNGSVYEEFSEQSFKKYPLRARKLENIQGKKIKLPKPFYELICFSDCEGVIGPEVAKKLYKDFCDYYDIAKEHIKEKWDGWFYEKYKEWKEAFRVASENGAVHFH